jgi:hypothetical protein
VKARERLAVWVRSLGVKDPELSPNHAWRHTFKAVGFRCGMSEKLLDAIVGHAPASVGRGYGEPTLVDKAQELRKFPRYAQPPYNKNHSEPRTPDPQVAANVEDVIRS